MAVTVTVWKTSILTGASILALLSILVYIFMVQAALQNSEACGFVAWLIFLIPGLLVLFGTYMHVAQRRHWGVVLLWSLGIVNVLTIVLSFPGIAIAFEQQTWIVAVRALEFFITIFVLAMSVVLALAQRSRRPTNRWTRAAIACFS